MDPASTILVELTPSVTSTHSMSGSARNQVRWRFAKATLRWASRAIAVLERRLAIEDRPRFAVADRAECRERGIETLAQDARLLQRGRRRTVRGRGPRSAADARPGRASGRARSPRPGSRAAPVARRHPTISAISRARTTRRWIAQVDAGGRGRRDRPQALDQGREPIGLEVALDPGADRRVARKRVGVQAAGDRPQVQPGAAGEDRDAATLVDRRERASGVGREVRDAEWLVGIRPDRGRDAAPSPARRRWPWPCRCPSPR